MKLIIYLFIVVILKIGLATTSDAFIVVKTAQGIVMGKRVVSSNSVVYNQFLGIPYAKPPVGELRFKAPVPIKSWNGTLNALEEGNVCIQMARNQPGVIGDEDCLFLNVYIPQLQGPSGLLPVMFYIHGGGFMAGSGNKGNQGPEFLLKTGVIYVSINYRLGILGFLNTQDEAAPGNAAMKDQVQALRWVQQNIEAFGGNPKQVTIFGESAGGVCVIYHMVSPMTKGLFHQVISQSGAVTTPLAIEKSPVGHAFDVGKALGFSGNNTFQLVEFLRTMSAENIFTTAVTTISNKDRYRLMNRVHELPSLEIPAEGEEQFLPSEPIGLLIQGKFHKVPIIMGVNSAEGLLFLSDGGISGDFKTWEELDKHFIQIFTPELRPCGRKACGNISLRRIKRFYFGDQDISNNTLANFTEFTTDLFFSEPCAFGVKTMADASSAPVYLYHFTYDGDLNVSKKRRPELAKFPGACHADDLGYIFDVGLKVAEDSLDAKIRTKIVDIWSNFAQTGNPTPHGTEGLPVWLPHTNSSANYLEIGSEMVAKKDFKKRQIDFWNRIYSTYKH